MADKKITQLTASTTASNTDLLLVVTDPSGSPANKKMEVGDLFGETAQTVVTTFNLSSSGSSTLGGSTITLDAATSITLTRGTVINEDGADSDTRIESDNEVNMIFVDASADKVGIKTNAPAEALDVNSDAIRLRTARTPANSNNTLVGWAPGTITWDGSFIYVAIDSTTIKRASLSTF